MKKIIRLTESQIKFLIENDSMFWVKRILIEKCKDWFGEYLFEIYRMTCEEN